MNIKDVYINYVQYGNKKGKDVVLLHGWGQNISMMDPIGKGLEKDYHITIIDLPGFGDSTEPTYGYTIYDYYEVLKELLQKLKIKNPILVGHSFGGRVSIVYASKEKVDKLVLLSSPYKRSTKRNSLKVKILKIMKKIPIIKELESYMKNKIGSEDYRNATPMMKKILVNTVNEDLTEYLKKIEASTLLIWGENDSTASPVSDAYEAEKMMKEAGLVVYENCTHYAYIEQIDRTISILKSFFGGK